MRSLSFIPAVLLAVLVCDGALAGGNAEAGKAKAAQVCASCHGAEGNKPTGPEFPILAGQPADYLSRALSDYKSGKRNNPIMKGFASGLSRQEIDDLAAFFSTQESRLRTMR